MFKGWVYKNHSLNEDQTSELYQKSFTILYFNVRDGKIENRDAEVSTYLIGIAKKLVHEKFREIKEANRYQELENNIHYYEDVFEEREDLEFKREKINNALRILDKKCKDILKLYYYENYSMEAIAETLGYKNDKVAKKKKYECLQKLRNFDYES